MADLDTTLDDGWVRKEVRKQTVVTVTAVEGNPWCETRESRSVEIID